MVSISIMALVSTVIVTRQSAFNGAVLLRNQAYEVAFAIREAQLLAVNGQDSDIKSYGVSFSAGSNTYRLFKDEDNDFILDSGEQLGLVGRLDSRFQIRELFTQTTSHNDLTVVFTRPNFDAQFCRDEDGCRPNQLSNGPAYIDVARVGVIRDGAGDVRRVEMMSTGQISVITY